MDAVVAGMIVALSGVAHGAVATEQIGDTLIYGPASHEVHGFYVSPAMERNFSEYKKTAELSLNSGNWDGFFAYLAVKHGRLYVTALTVNATRDSDARTTPKKVFGVDLGRSGLLADWFSGQLTEYYGPFLPPIRLRVHSRARAFHFRNGVLEKIEDREVVYRTTSDLR